MPATRGRYEIVAEIGTAIHTDTSYNAERLIDELAIAGVHAIKTQIIIADEIVHPAARARINGTTVALHKHFTELERSPSFYRRLQQLCEKSGVDFFVSVFGQQSAQQALDIGCQRIKIASPEVNHTPLLRQVSDSGLPIILSGGVSKLGDIEMALGILRSERTTLLHCVTAYPANPADYNLRLLDTYAAAFSVSVGVSDHTSDPILVPAVAVLHNAVMIEKHAHLEQERGGAGNSHLDVEVAITPSQFARMSHALREITSAESRDEQIALLEEHLMRATTRNATQIRADIAAVEGDGVARLTSAEVPLYETTNRSLHATRAISRGEVLDNTNCAILRGESLGGGIAPALWERINGARTQCDIATGEGIKLSFLLEKTDCEK